MTNYEYIKNLDARALSVFLRRLRECGEVADCEADCPWRKFWKKDFESMDYSSFESFSRFECPQGSTQWLEEEVKPEFHIFD